MSRMLLSADAVGALHDAVMNPGELSGRARDKSPQIALARVDNKLAYGMIGDVFDLAAAYPEAIARGHCFNDANRRTAFRVMSAVLALNGERIVADVAEVGPRIVALAHGGLEAEDLAVWLRGRPSDR